MFHHIIIIMLIAFLIIIIRKIVSIRRIQFTVAAVYNFVSISIVLGEFRC